MKRPEPPPPLAPADVLDTPLDIDIDAVIAGAIAQRKQSPIVNRYSMEDVLAWIPHELPRAGEAFDQVVAVLDEVVRCARRNTHPGFMGYVASIGLPTDPLAHAMTAALNQNVVGYPASPGATTIERTVVRWLADLAGLPPEADGVMLSGGSQANLTGVAAALYSRMGAAREQGLAACGETPVILTTAAVHFSVQRAALLLGVGTGNVRNVDVDDAWRMQPAALEAAIERVVSDGCTPVCVVATAGSTSTGAIDPLAAVADVCARHSVWLHVDAAYGAAGLMSAELKPLLDGIERADSVTIDLHKWFFLALDSSVVLFREPARARSLFFAQADYLQYADNGVPEEHMFFHLGPELSRRFRALPAYLALRHYGIERLGRNVLYNAQCARYLAELVEAEPELQLVSTSLLSICCFRFVPFGGADKPDRIDALNVATRDRLEREGDFLLSPTSVQGRPVLRACIVNHATHAEHIESLVDDVLRIGRDVATEFCS